MTTVKTVLPELFRRDDGPPLLQEKDEEILDEVFQEAQQTIRNRHYGDGMVSTAELADNIAIVRENFVRIINALRLSPNAKRKFIRNYDSWEGIRKKTVEDLREKGNALHLDRRNSNVARLVGNSTSCLGGAMVIAGAVLAPLSFGASLPLAAGGASLVVAGAGASVGASITENVLEHNNVTAAQEILNKDKEASADLNPWLTHSLELANALDKIGNINIVKEITDTVKDTVREAVALRQGHIRQEAVKIVVAGALALIPGDLGNLVQCTAMFISMVIAIILLRERNQLICDCASFTFRIVFGIMSLLDGSIDIGMTVARIFTGNAAVARTVGAGLARGAVAVLGMSLDIAMIVMTSIDVHNGSLNRRGTAILDIANQLDREAEEMKKIYQHLREDYNRGRGSNEYYFTPLSF